MPDSPKKYTVNLCYGPLLRQIIVFILPMMGSTLLQLGFHAADIVVIGRYSTHEALAAVGSTSSFNSLLVCFMNGFAVGASVLTAKLYGANSKTQLSDTTHTSVALSLLCGFTVMIVGLVVSRPVLNMMMTPPEVLPLALVYIRIIFAGIPLMMLFNFGNGILRAAGDTRRPLYYLALAGVVNLLLNLLFVIVFHMGVSGVALATVISQAVSAVLVMYTIAKTSELGGLHLRKLRMRRHVLSQIFAVGIPSAFQSCSFCVANIIIQSMVNTFGGLAMAGNTAALTIENFLSLGTSCFNDTAISFTGQNLGGRKYSRVKKSLLYNTVLSIVLIAVCSTLFLIFGRQMLAFFNGDPEIIEWGYKRMLAMFPYYITGGTMNVFSGTLKGSGHATASFIIVFFGACIFRVIWVFWIFPMHRTLEMLLYCFPISWVIISAIAGVFIYATFRHFPKKDG